MLMSISIFTFSNGNNRHHRNNLIAHVFCEWKEVVNVAKRERALFWGASSFYRGHGMRVAVERWTKWTANRMLKKAQIKAANELRSRFILRTAIKDWKKAVDKRIHLNRKFLQALGVHKIHTLAGCLKEWKFFVRAQQEKADDRCERFFLRKMSRIMDAWYVTAGALRLKRRKIRKAVSHFSNAHVAKTFARWRDFHEEYMVNVRLAKSVIESREQRTVRRCFIAIRDHAEGAIGAREVESRGQALLRARLIAHGWKKWRYAFKVREAGHAARAVRNRFLSEKTFFAWYGELEVELRHKRLVYQQLQRLRNQELARSFVTWVNKYRYQKHCREAAWAVRGMVAKRRGQKYFAIWDEKTTQKISSRKMKNKALLHLTNRTLSVSFRKWQEEWEKSVELGLKLAPFLSKLRFGATSKAFTTLAAHASEQKHKRETIERAVFHFENHTRVKAFATWSTHVKQAIRNRNVLAMASRRMQNMSQHKAFRGWHEFAVQKSDARAKAEVMIQQWKLRGVTEAFRKWTDTVSEIVRFRNHAESVIAAFRDQKRMRALRTWIAWTEERVKNRYQLENAMVTMRNASVSKAIRTWRRFASKRLENKEKMHTALAFMHQGLLMRMMTQWVSFTAECVRTRDAEAYAKHFFENRHAIVAVRRWRGWSVRRAHNRNLLKKAASFLGKSSLTRCMHTWINTVAETKAKRELFQRVTLHMRDFQALRGIEKWKQFTNQRRDYKKLVKKAFTMMSNRSLAMSMAQWKYMLKIRRTLRRHLVIMQKRTLNAAFYGWHQSVYVQSKLRHVRKFNIFTVWRRNSRRSAHESLVVNNCILKMQKRALARSFCSFQDNVELARAQRKAANFFQNGVLFRVFRQWKNYTANEVRIRLAGRVLFENRTKAAIARWRKWAEDRARMTEKLHQVATRIMHIELAKCMKTWVDMTSKSLRVKHFMRRQLDRSCYHWLHAWKENTDYCKRLGLAHYRVSFERKRRVKKKLLIKWFDRSKFMDAIHGFEKVRQTSFLVRMMQYWKDYTAASRAEHIAVEQLEDRIELFPNDRGTFSTARGYLRWTLCKWRSLLCASAFSAWRELLSAKSAEMVKMKKAWSHWGAFNTRVCFARWIEHRNEQFKARRAATQWLRRSQASAFRKWRANAQEQIEDNRKAAIARNFLVTGTLAGTFYQWGSIVRYEKNLARRAKALRQACAIRTRRQTLARWQMALMQKRANRIRLLQASTFCDTQAMSRAFCGWADYVWKRNHREAVLKASLQRLSQLTRLQHFRAWKSTVAHRVWKRTAMYNLAQRSIVGRLHIRLQQWRVWAQQRVKIKSAFYKCFVRQELYLALRTWKRYSAAITKMEDNNVKAMMYRKLLFTNKKKAAFINWYAGVHEQQREKKVYMGWLLGNLLPKCFAKWKFWQIQRRNFASLSVRLALQMKNRTLSRAFNGWHARAEALGKQRKNVSNMIKRMQRQTELKSFLTWRSFAARQARNRVAVRTSLSRMRNKELVRCFEKWWKITEYNCRIRNAYEDVRAISNFNLIARKLVHWRARFEEQSRMYDLIEKASAAFRMKTEASAFRRWKDFYFEILQQKRLLRRAVASFTKKRLLEGVRRWADHTARRIERREMVERAGMHLKFHRLTRAWKGFTETTSWWRERRAAAQTVSCERSKKKKNRLKKGPLIVLSSPYTILAFAGNTQADEQAYGTELCDMACVH